MAKRLTPQEKKEIIKSFTAGKSIDSLSNCFSCTKLTIIRNIKKEIGEKRYKELIKDGEPKKEKIIENIENDDSFNSQSKKQSSKPKLSYINNPNESDFVPESAFLEITPLLDHEFEDISRKEFSSVPISDVNLPEIVYMIVDKTIELEIKFLKEYPNWDFLPEKDLNRKTIEIYMDLKSAKRSCRKDQKVIKVPNSNIFKIVSSLLTSRGITRIVSADKLIAL